MEMINMVSINKDNMDNNTTFSEEYSIIPKEALKEYLQGVNDYRVEMLGLAENQGHLKMKGSSKMKEINGDLIQLFKDGEFDIIIIHGCNCFHRMGVGIAALIAKEFPEAYNVDCETAKGEDKRGSFSFAGLESGQIVINAYTQYRPGPYARLYAIEKAFQNIWSSGITNGKKVGIPAIGCGIGGLLLAEVKEAFEKSGIEDLTLVHYSQ